MMFQIIKECVRKVRFWGFTGVCNYFLGLFKASGIRRFFLNNAKLQLAQEPGVTVVAPFQEKHSLSKAMRDLVFCIHEAGIPVQALDSSDKTQVANREIEPLLTPRKAFRIMKHPLAIELFAGKIPPEIPIRRAHVVFWEFESGLLEAFPALRSVDTVIAMSDFNAVYFRRALPPTVKVAKILYPFRFSPPTLPPHTQTRRHFGVGENDFAVFFNFDYRSSFFRKNPDGAMRAFAKAFSDTPDAKLVFKTNHSKDYPKAHAALCDLAVGLGIADRFISIDDFLQRDDIYAITAACDIYLSLHRGEGFGLGIAEAMSLGKPAIVTDYGGSTEFCTSETAILVPYAKIALKRGQIDNPCYHEVAFCADPDIDAAAAAMRKCYESRGICLDMGSRAKLFMESHFSSGRFRESLATLMKGFRADG